MCTCFETVKARILGVTVCSTWACTADWNVDRSCALSASRSIALPVYVDRRHSIYPALWRGRTGVYHRILKMGGYVFLHVLTSRSRMSNVYRDGTTRRYGSWTGPFTVYTHKLGVEHASTINTQEILQITREKICFWKLLYEASTVMCKARVR